MILHSSNDIFEIIVHKLIEKQADNVADLLTDSTVKYIRHTSDNKNYQKILDRNWKKFISSVPRNFAEFDKKKISFTNIQNTEIFSMMRIITDMMGDTAKKRLLSVLKKDKSNISSSICKKVLQNLNGNNVFDPSYHAAILLGEPGTGKTTIQQMIGLLVKYVITVSKRKVIPIWFTGAIFDSVENPVQFFEYLSEMIEENIKKGYMVLWLIDEAEELFKVRSNNSISRHVLEFMSRIKGMTNKYYSKGGQFIMISATNISDNFDHSVIRRFTRFVDFRLLNNKSTKEILINRLYEIFNKDDAKKIVNHEIFDVIFDTIIEYHSTISPGELENIISKMHSIYYNEGANSSVALILAMFCSWNKHLRLVNGKSHKLVIQDLKLCTKELMVNLGDYIDASSNLIEITDFYFFKTKDYNDSSLKQISEKYFKLNI